MTEPVTYAPAIDAWTALALLTMAVTVIALVGERLLPHVTAMWAVVRLGWMEIRKGRRR